MPVYGCRDCLPLLHERLRASVERITPDYELVFVDDRSPDGAWDVLTTIARSNPSVRILRLSRNFGQHRAITAGLANAVGRWVVVMDCDLQDPPEEIPRLYAKAREGFDIVLARRRTHGQSRLRRLASTTYYRLRRYFIRLDVDPNFCTLSILSRKVVNAFLQVRDMDRQYMLILHWLGFERAVIDVEKAERAAGRSSYTLRRLVRLGVDGFFFETTILLRWIVYFGFMIALAGVGLAAALVAFYVFADPLPGFTSIAVLILLIGGFIIVSTGVTGLYIGKVFSQVKSRPLFVVDEDVMFDQDAPEDHHSAEVGVADRGGTSL
ncbi:MAG: glycosyltransferase family 2 protein [Gaiellaceae bacterium]